MSIMKKHCQIFLVMTANSTTIDLSCIKFPLSLSQIKMFHLKNSNLGIFILGNDDDKDYQKRKTISIKSDVIRLKTTKK